MNNGLYLQMANYLLLHSFECKDVSLYHGKTGIVLALMMYSKVSGNFLLRDYSEDLFQTIYYDIHDGMSFCLETGLTGVGYGLTLMKMAELIDCDLNDVLRDIDARIMDYNLSRIHDLSFRKGIAGIYAYINLRYTVDSKVETFDSEYLKRLSSIYNTFRKQINNEINKQLINDLDCPNWDENMYLNRQLGLEQGCSYYLFKECYDKIFSYSK